MPDYRSYFDSDYIGHWDLQGQEVTVTINRVEAGELKNEKGTSHKPIVFFEGKQKGMVLNKTNAKTIAGLYGADTAKWKGKKVILYPTTCQAFGQTQDCIRVRNEKPK